MFQVFKTKYHSKKLNAKDNSHNTPTICKIWEIWQEPQFWKEKKKQWVIYYSDTEDMGAYFPQKYFDYLPKK